MTERFVFHNPSQDRHKGWVDQDGKKWDVPQRIFNIVSELLSDTTGTEWFILLETHPETLELLKQIHNRELIRAIQEASEQASESEMIRTSYDKDVQSGSSGIYSGTYEQALMAVECAVTAADALISDGKRLTLSLSRPPGHHAGKEFYHGFCYFNNAAAAAYELKEAGKRVAILDIDVHHGDGTQDIFYNDGQVLYVSIHANPEEIFPHTGYSDEKGEENGEGATINLPFPVGVSVEEYFNLVRIAKSRIQEFHADCLVISAGFDTHKREYADLPPVTQLETEDYHSLGALLGEMSLPSCVVLEGGYNTETLPKALLQFMKGMEEGMQIVSEDMEMYSSDVTPPLEE